MPAVLGQLRVQTDVFLCYCFDNDYPQQKSRVDYHHFNRNMKETAKDISIALSNVAAAAAADSALMMKYANCWPNVC